MNKKLQQIEKERNEVNIPKDEKDILKKFAELNRRKLKPFMEDILIDWARKHKNKLPVPIKS